MPKSLDDKCDDRREGAANHQAYRSQLEAYQARCEECLQQLLAIENQIRRVAHWLRFAQPAYSTGRISIRWWPNDRSGIRHPHLVRWLRTVDGERMKPVPYKRRPRKLPDYGAGAFNSEVRHPPMQPEGILGTPFRAA